MTLGENVPTDKKTLHLASYKLDVSFLLVHIHAISSPKVLAGRASTAWKPDVHICRFAKHLLRLQIWAEVQHFFWVLMELGINLSLSLPLLFLFPVTVVLFTALRRQRKKEPLIISKEDIRDNIVSYNDEGGGEEDTQAFDIGTLRNPEAIDDNKLRRDIVPETLFMPRRTATARDNTDVRDFINQRLKENDTDPTAPPYDSLATYAYEGNGSVAESLSSLESVTTDGDQDYDYLSDWGPRFKKLADMYGAMDSDKDS